jgi:UPF0271 protein
MGEGLDNDEALMPYIEATNIACGYHAGDTDTIKKTIALAQKNKVQIGAHFSYLDRENFGRKEMYLSNAAVYDMVSEQLHLFSNIAKEMGQIVTHVKPHGALYNQAAKNIEYNKLLKINLETMVTNMGLPLPKPSTKATKSIASFI